MKFYSSLDSDHTTNAGKADAAVIKQQADGPVPEWKRILRMVRFRPHSWPLEVVPRSSKRILDLGCGNGAKLIEFFKRGYEVWGVDVSEQAIGLCEQVLPEGHFRVAELGKTGLPAGHFDYIRIDNALEHVPNPKEVISECCRLLCGGGKLMIYVPHGKSLSMRMMKGNSISSWIPFHLQLFTHRSLYRLMKKAGLTDIRIRGFNPTSWLPLSIMQWMNRKSRTSECCLSDWVTWVCYPIGWIASRFGLAEELFGIGVKC